MAGKIVNSRIVEFIGPYTVPHHDERSKIVGTDHDGVIKRYSTSQAQSFEAQPSVLYDAITEREIGDRHSEGTPKDGKPTYDEKKIQLNVNSQPYGEQSISADSDNVQKIREKEVAKATEIFKQTDEIINHKPSNPRRDDTIGTNFPLRRDTRQQSHTARCLATRTGS